MPEKVKELHVYTPSKERDLVRILPDGIKIWKNQPY